MLGFPGSIFYQHFPSYQQMHGFPGNLMYVPGFPGYPTQDPQSDSADHKKQSFREKVMGSVSGKVKRLSGEDESRKSDEEGSEYDDTETTPVENKKCKKDKFWNMPPILKTRISTRKRTPEESFSELPLYCHNLKLKNPGTITHVETDDDDRFEIFFLPWVLREDDYFTRGSWLSAVQYLTAEGSITIGCFDDMKTFCKNGKREKVVAGGRYGKAITVGVVLILRNVSVFSLKSSGHYLNITLKNMVKWLVLKLLESGCHVCICVMAMVSRVGDLQRWWMGLVVEAVLRSDGGGEVW
ncbi:transposase, MuDR, MULE transposase domain protein [Tanacetum coccineum]